MVFSCIEIAYFMVKILAVQTHLKKKTVCSDCKPKCQGYFEYVCLLSQSPLLLLFERERQKPRWYRQRQNTQ